MTLLVKIALAVCAYTLLLFVSTFVGAYINGFSHNKISSSLASVIFIYIGFVLLLCVLWLTYASTNCWYTTGATTTSICSTLFKLADRVESFYGHAAGVAAAFLLLCALPITIAILIKQLLT